MKRGSLNFSTVLICGGRKYDDWEFFNLYMKTLPWTMSRSLKLPKKIGLVITGDATGADALARRWAKKNKIELLVEKSDWDTHGRAAGPLRNEFLADHYPTVGVEFPGGKETKDMTFRLIKRGILVFIANPSLKAHCERIIEHESKRNV